MARSTVKFLKQQGQFNARIAAVVGCDRHTVARVLAEPTTLPRRRRPGPRRGPDPRPARSRRHPVGKAPAPGRSVKAFNPIARADSHLFGALMSGDHILRGFANRDLRDKLRPPSFPLSDNPKTQSAQVSRLLHRLHVYGLVAQIPRSRRWRVSGFRYRLMSASLPLRRPHRAACQGRGVSRLSLRRKKR
jgi:hypothetical protein